MALSYSSYGNKKRRAILDVPGGFNMWGTRLHFSIWLLGEYRLGIYGMTGTIIIGLSTNQFRRCAAVNIPSWSWAYWVPSITFDSITLGLAVIKSVTLLKTTPRPPRFILMLLIDSILYFGSVISWTLANILTWSIMPVPLYGTFVGMLLRIREAAAAHRLQEQENENESTEMDGNLSTNVDGWFSDLP
ncbi:hypothetical protein BU17DRAFT_68674 [Hysterangium stoloniferum]|nr:hypothetical protein BU17DRAFT_68674 [Hysterangium stoloniferum]